MPGCLDSRSPARNALSPSTEPIDRSTLRVMITSVWPTARIAKIDALSARLRSELVSMKRGSRIAVTVISSASAADDAELADAQHPLGQAAGAGALGGCGGVRAHAASTPSRRGSRAPRRPRRG